jgi:uncharacterized heparinase superfamily protein
LIQDLEKGELCLVNQSLPLTVEAPEWRLGPQQEDRLWIITLHYHAWLYELSKLIGCDHDLAPQADVMVRSLLQDWLKACTLDEPGIESLAWSPYAIATRLGWWARLWYSLGEEYWQQHSSLAEQLLRSMYSQAAYLASHLEWDLRANHLLRDAVGLAWAGRFFHGDQPARWLELARQIACAQTDEQMLNDGGHFERSPFYHLEAMDDWLSLALLLRDERASNKMRKTWQHAADYVRWLCHPDGCIAQLNDGAAVAVDHHLSHGAAHSLDMRQVSPAGARWCESSGIVAWRGDPWTIFWDVGEIGPDYQPGHAHADTLTIEASYRGCRLFVDPGCHSYDNDQRRRYDRSTDAHNTVCIDGQNSSEVWHVFRVGRRARPRIKDVWIHADGIQATASHTGYDHLPGRPRHTRQLDVRQDDPLRIIDRVAGDLKHEVTGGLLLAPEWSAELVTGGWMLARGAQLLIVRIDGPAEMKLSIEQRPFHPDYGVELQTQRLQWCCAGRLPTEVAIVVDELESRL